MEAHRIRLLFGLTLALAVAALTGFASPARPADAHTTTLSAFPAGQVVGNFVSFSVAYTDDENHDPVISIDSGVFTSGSPAGCLVGIGTNSVTINDEACDLDDSSEAAAVSLRTRCVEAGTHTITSNLHTGVNPSSTTFTCVETAPRVRRATLDGQSPVPDAYGTATLYKIGNAYIVTVNASRLDQVAPYFIAIANTSGCRVIVSEFVFSSLRGKLNVTQIFTVSFFETTCGGEPDEVHLVLTNPITTHLKGTLRPAIADATGNSIE